jgi:hypothetical protein
MYEIAEPSTHTALATVEPAAGLTEVGDGGEFAVDGSAGVPARVEGVACFLSVVLIFEACIDIADKILSPIQLST